MLATAHEGLTVGFDRRWGGWGHAPKFPAAATLEFLLRGEATEMAEQTLDGMAAGGMYDLVGGGFHRYSVDERWLVPHFEKMLYDNAQLAVAYLHGWRVLGKERYRRVAESTIEYLLRELALDRGRLRLGAGRGHRRGRGAHLHVDAVGGRAGRAAPPVRGRTGSCSAASSTTRHGRSSSRLRERRPKPALDDKAVASWNGLALAALAECGRSLDRADWVEAARRLGAFLLGQLSTDDGRLHRTWRDGVAKGTGYLEDYADVANGLLELHVATGELRWLEESRRLALLAIELFLDPEHGGFFQAPVDGEQLVAPKKNFDDHPEPSGNTMLAYVLLRLAPDLRRRRARGARSVRPAADRGRRWPGRPSAFGWGLVALDLHLSPRREIAIVGPADSPVARAALARWEPHAVVAFGPDDGVPLLAGKGFVDGRPAVYLCERFACRAPVTEPADL